jgi:hypothetical protein
MRARLLLTLMVPALSAPLPANAADLSAFQRWFRVDVPVQLVSKPNTSTVISEHSCGACCAAPGPHVRAPWRLGAAV